MLDYPRISRVSAVVMLLISLLLVQQSHAALETPVAEKVQTGEEQMTNAGSEVNFAIDDDAFDAMDEEDELDSGDSEGEGC